MVGWRRGCTGASAAVLREHAGLCGALLCGPQGTGVDVRSPLLTRNVIKRWLKAPGSVSLRKVLTQLGLENRRHWQLP